MNNIGENVYNNLYLLPEDVQGWNSEGEIFRDLITEIKPKVIIEVGTWKGASAIKMGLLCKELGLNTKIYCVDTWLGAQEFWTTHKTTKERGLMLRNGYPQIYYQFISNVVHKGLYDCIIPVPNTSSNAARIFKHLEIKADLIYIDGSHEYDDVISDIKNYRALLNPGGIMFGDDYLTWADVANAVKDTLPDHRVLHDNFWIRKF